MCELGFFFTIFLKNDFLKVDKILVLTFFRQEKTSKDSKRRFSIFNGFHSDFVETTSCVYTKTIILFNLGE